MPDPSTLNQTLAQSGIGAVILAAMSQLFSRQTKATRKAQVQWELRMQEGMKHVEELVKKLQSDMLYERKQRDELRNQLVGNTSKIIDITDRFHQTAQELGRFMALADKRILDLEEKTTEVVQIGKDLKLVRDRLVQIKKGESK